MIKFLPTRISAPADGGLSLFVRATILIPGPDPGPDPGKHNQRGEGGLSEKSGYNGASPN